MRRLRQRPPAPGQALRLGAGLMLLALLAGCGSTVQLNGTAPGNVGLSASEGAVALGDDGMALSSEAASSTTGTTGGAAPAGSTTASGAAAPGTTAGGAAPGAAGTSASGGGKQRTARGGQMGPGVTADEVVVGIALADDTSRAGNENLLGASGLAGGDSERYYEIMRTEINRRGGIAGRKVRYSKFRYSTADGSQVSRLEQEACEYWTSDDRAFTGEISASGTFLSCAESRQLATTAEALTASDDKIFATYPHHLQLGAMSLTQQMAVMPRGLNQQGYFDRGYRLGIVTYNDPVFARVVDGILVPALKAQGKQVHTEIQRVKKLNSNEELGELSAQIQSAVLKFKSENITHVLIIEEDALVTLLFTRSAENQSYRPRYGLNSQNGPTALRDNVPAGQYNRAVGIGWIPNLDVPANELPPNRARERCLATYAKHGEKPANANNAAIMVGICERMEFLKAAIEAGAPDITIDSFIRGAEALKGTFPSYSSIGTMAIGPGRHAGAAYYRHLKYDAGCNCFHYTSKPIPVR